MLVTALLGVVGIASTYAMSALSRRHERDLQQSRAEHATVERQRAERRDLYLRLLEAVEDVPEILNTLALFNEGEVEPSSPDHPSNIENVAKEQLAGLRRLRPRVRFEATSSVVRALDDVSEATRSLDYFEYERGLVDAAITAIEGLRAAIRQDQGLGV